MAATGIISTTTTTTTTTTSLPAEFNDEFGAGCATEFARMFDDDFEMPNDLSDPLSTSTNSTADSTSVATQPPQVIPTIPTACSNNNLPQVAAVSTSSCGGVGSTKMDNAQVLVPPQPTKSQQPFVNVILVVDPTSKQVFCPKQLLVYNSGASTSTALLGPTVWNGSSQDVISNLTGQFQQQQQRAASPMLPIPPSFTVAQPSLTAPLTSCASPTLAPPIAAAAPVPSSFLTQKIAAPAVTPPPPTTTTTTTSEGTLLAPLRALSAYNFFFRDERDRILHGGELDFSEAKKQRLLSEHWEQDRTKKRRHRKTHGKIDFTTLSKLISQRWKSLTDDEKDFYRQVGAADWDRYQRELKQYKAATGNNNNMETYQAVVA